jgi:nucleoside-diphosphate-sugar epimerase
MRVAVTGASGFIGGAIATALANREHDVTGFGRRPDGWAHPAAHYEVWDLTRGTAPSSGFDAVVHAAALADDWAPRATAMRVNQLGTRAVVTAFPGVRIVHLSTSSVYDAHRPTVHATESEGPATRVLSTYSESKAAAESELRDADAVILRPHAVYGPGDTTLLPRVIAAVRGSVLRLPEGARVQHTLTHVDNLVRAAILGLHGPAGIYNVGDATDVPLDAVLREFLAKRGMGDVRIRSVPYRVAYRTAAALELLARPIRRTPRLTRYAVSQLGLERTLDLTAAREGLGYDPGPTTLAGAERW